MIIFMYSGPIALITIGRKLRIEGCSMIEGVKIEIRRKRKDFFLKR